MQAESFDEKAAGRKLIDWYYVHGRALPWRRTIDPYAILVSEIMLQQTRVETVQERYLSFLERFPDIQTLAEADEDAVLKEWQGLGYYRRARNLHQAAKYICENYDGQVPADEEKLLAIPGIGPYTASAVRAISFELPSLALDANGYKVFARLYALDEPLESSSAKTKIRDWAQKWLCADYPGDFAQAVMDLSATVCLSPVPKCERCPLNIYCQAYRLGRQNDLPVHKEKAERKVENLTFFAYLLDGRVALEKRPSNGLLADMYGFPGASGHPRKKKAIAHCSDQGFEVEHLIVGPDWRHTFTHLIWLANSYLVFVRSESDHAYVWATREELEHVYAIPSAFAPLLEAAVQQMR